MKDPNLLIGELIRTYRKSKGMTLIDFAEKIHKSKATVSKYEKGEISIDVNTLIEISKALDIPAARLIEAGEQQQQSKKPGLSNGGSFFSDKDTFYVYFFDGRVNKIRRNIIKISREESSDTNPATLFFNVKDFDNPHKCKSLYYGNVVFGDLFMYFYFDNQSSRLEKVWMCAVNPLERVEYVYCMLSGISGDRLFPASFKCILADHIITDEDRIQKITMLDKNDIKGIKQMNMFTFSALSETEE